MTDPTPTQNPVVQPAETPTTPLRCLTGALIAGGMAYCLYLLTVSISQTFAAKPISSDNVTAINIAIAVRTLVVGMSALGTCIFGLVTLGLLALAIQITFQRLTNRTPPPTQ
ncbi:MULTISPECIES: DUF3082 domain-containing protein [Cyanophyceae]|uniref:DUF3082 domain-containing protein n=1 Tax=Cyanophyceae TaxID=3028117 RepID=UPI0016840CA1|nr:DUF3082 domain-containing protein [Trichocoleus sp. FACHB-69]MBD1932119.1 DUF3082 domain-containing protein [Trichocoleus sp. FACHB-69]